jgi:hypothetical protein
MIVRQLCSDWHDVRTLAMLLIHPSRQAGISLPANSICNFMMSAGKFVVHKQIVSAIQQICLLSNNSTKTSMIAKFCQQVSKSALFC